MASYGTNDNPFSSDEPDKIQEARKQVIHDKCFFQTFHYLMVSSLSSTNVSIEFFYIQVDDVVGIMRENVEKVMERDQKLSDLDDR